MAPASARQTVHMYSNASNVARHRPRVTEAGSGLGLMIVAELNEVMKGEVSVTALQPTGAGLTVRFPATHDRPAP